MHMPFDIFAEVRAHELSVKTNSRLIMPHAQISQVVSYLLPLDLLRLARTSKCIRSVLTNANISRGMWKRAIANVPGLPACREEMSEIAYTAFLFTFTCSEAVSSCFASRLHTAGISRFAQGCLRTSRTPNHGMRRLCHVHMDE